MVIPAYWVYRESKRVRWPSAGLQTYARLEYGGQVPDWLVDGGRGRRRAVRTGGAVRTIRGFASALAALLL